MIRRAYAPPEDFSPPHGYCPDCDAALVDPDSCRCGWYELVSSHTSAKAPSPAAAPTQGEEFCTRCLRRHARTGDAEERCQRGMQFADMDFRRRGGW